MFSLPGIISRHGTFDNIPTVEKISAVKNARSTMVQIAAPTPGSSKTLAQSANNSGD